MALKWSEYGLLSKYVNYLEEPIENIAKPDYSKYPILIKGSRGEYVKILQTLLLKKGYDCKGIDGIWGNNTEKAVRNFQSDPKNTDINGKRLVVDGCVGPLTWGALYK